MPAGADKTLWIVLIILILRVTHLRWFKHINKREQWLYIKYIKNYERNQP